MSRSDVTEGQVMNSSQEGCSTSSTLGELQADCSFDVSCKGSVPHSIRAFLEAESLEHAIRLAVSMGGDADTMACIAASIAEAFYGGVSDSLWRLVMQQLDSLMLATTAERSATL